MSRYTINERDLVCTVGMDFAVQWWLTDHRGTAVPVERPARITVLDPYGQQLFDAEAPDDAETLIDPLADPVLEAAPVNGMLQLRLPRAMTASFVPGIYNYDIWATVWDDPARSMFPDGQQLPVARGRFVVHSRITQMEAP